jgi:hypothetical protein
MTHRNKQTISGLLYKNNNGGFIQPGRMYQLPRKVSEVYLELCKEPAHPSVKVTAKLSKVSWCFANLVVTKLKAIGAVLDPEFKQRKKQYVLGPGQKLSIVHEMFLLSLQTLDPARPLYSYAQDLERHFNKSISYQCCIADWFHKHWDHKGNLKKANLVPLDKWKVKNKLRYYKFVQKLRIFNNRSKYNFLDKKNVWNKDIYAKKFQKDPLTGKLPCIHVTTGFASCRRH